MKNKQLATVLMIVFALLFLGAIIAIFVNLSGHTHDYILEDMVEPTCTADGYATYSCSSCGYTYNEPLRATGHTYTESSADPTCEEEGYTLHKCSSCGEEYKTDLVEALGHTEEDASLAPTCERDGYNKTVCSVCGKALSYEWLGRTDHAYEEIAVEATCTSGGYTLYTCSVCGYSYKDNLTAAAEHDYILESYSAATQLAVYVCSVCGDSYTITTALDPSEDADWSDGGKADDSDDNSDGNAEDNGDDSSDSSNDNSGGSSLGDDEDSNTEEPYSYEEVDGGYALVAFSGFGTAIVPAEYNGKPVVAVGNEAFKNNTALTGVSIEEGVRALGVSCFSGCSALSSVVLPSSLESIGEGCFRGCSALTKITIPSGVTLIGAAAFYESGLETVQVSGEWTYDDGTAAFDEATDSALAARLLIQDKYNAFKRA